MRLPEAWKGRVRLPAIAAPMFLVSNPALVAACCRAGVVAAFPALNQRTTAEFVAWLDELQVLLGEGDAPFGVNLAVHRSNPRMEADLQKIVDHRVPLVITALGVSADIVAAIHSYGGLIFHDAIGVRHAEKAVRAGVDGLIAVSAGAGGHAGHLSPFALVPELRTMFDGYIALSGCVGSGAAIVASLALGADFGYIGTRFIATQEAAAAHGYKQMLLDSSAADIVYTPRISGVPANFMRASIIAAGIDPDDLSPKDTLDFGTELAHGRAWRDIWSAGQGVGAIRDLPPAGELCERLIAEFDATRRALAF